MSKKILILYAKSGFLGHKMIAEDYGRLLGKNGYEVKLGDLFEIDNKTEIKAGTNIYFWIISSAPWIWQFFYRFWSYIPGVKFFRNNVLPNEFKKTQELILEYKPDLIITTHPNATSVVNYLKQRKLYTNPLFTTFSDWHTQEFWIYKNVDKYLLVIPEHKADLLKMGFRDDQTIVTGILVNETYYEPKDKIAARQELNLPIDKKIIVVMGGGRGWMIENTLAELAKLNTPCHVVVIGGSPERQTILRRFLETSRGPRISFEVTGFVDPKSYFSAADLLISKPGGLTSSEAFLTKLPLLALAPLPGQEDENVKYLLKKGAIQFWDKKGSLSALVDELLQSPEKLAETAQNAYKLAPVNAPEIILAQIKGKLYSGG